MMRVCMFLSRDGYGSTSKMITERVMCLVKECEDLAGGIYTPAPSTGTKPIKKWYDHIKGHLPEDFEELLADEMKNKNSNCSGHSIFYLCVKSKCRV